jgi:hypothetical protein
MRRAISFCLPALQLARLFVVFVLRNPPRAIYPLNPGRVRVKLDKSAFPYKLSHYEFTLDGKVFTFQPHQILHMKYPDPGDRPTSGLNSPGSTGTSKP